MHVLGIDAGGTKTVALLADGDGRYALNLAEGAVARVCVPVVGDHVACLGENRKLKGAAYGNVALSRFPLKVVTNHDLSVEGYERRGALHTDVALTETEVLHVFNVHLGTAFLERRHQARRLSERQTGLLHNEELRGPKIVLGDFNEWMKGLTTELLSAKLNSVDLKQFLPRRRTYPGLFPLLHLDHIYYAGQMEILGVELPRTRLALVASDHLPLVADVRVGM